MTDLNIVLCEPEIPQNTGNIARTCAVTGAALHIIKPMGFTPDAAKLRRAGLDYWDKLDITYYESLDEFLAEKAYEKIWFFTTKAKKCYTDVAYPERVFIMFGKESAGLPEELLLSHPDNCVRIPMLSELRSLNLSNSVAIAAYEVLRQHGFEQLELQGNLHRYNW
ncbi:MAG: tRNA (cytidine(34)-2'-O)-methyltransferase [Firmicutes bacterium]|nr:tRNA (cytidine(34)-2'-O)-methyltransferase [Bacillota bacterium]